MVQHLRGADEIIINSNLGNVIRKKYNNNNKFSKELRA